MFYAIDLLAMLHLLPEFPQRSLELLFFFVSFLFVYQLFSEAFQRKTTDKTIFPHEAFVIYCRLLSMKWSRLFFHTGHFEGNEYAIIWHIGKDL